MCVCFCVCVRAHVHKLNLRGRPLLFKLVKRTQKNRKNFLIPLLQPDQVQLVDRTHTHTNNHIHTQPRTWSHTRRTHRHTLKIHMCTCTRTRTHTSPQHTQHTHTTPARKTHATHTHSAVRFSVRVFAMLLLFRLLVCSRFRVFVFSWSMSHVLCVMCSCFCVFTHPCGFAYQEFAQTIL